MYINRSFEEKLLETFYTGKERVACLYGRNGMGKSTLIRHFLEGKKSLYFHAYPTTDKEELLLFSRALGLEYHDSLEDILNEITLDELVGHEPLLFVIDQYPDFVKADPNFEIILYRYITEVWSELPIKVVFCGDSYTHMEKYILGKKSIWKGKPVVEMEIGNMHFQEAKAFFPERTPEEMVYLYGITGGIPKRMEAVYGQSPEEATKTLYFQKNSEIYWPMQSMQKELRELSYYNRMLRCLANGKQRVNEISAEVEKPKDVVVPYLNTLMSIGMVTKENPITERTNRKKTRYSIVNTADAFWYSYMPDYINIICQQDEQGIEELLELMQQDESHFLKTVFINMCKEFLMNIHGNASLPFQLEEIGNWWMNDEEHHVSTGFDIVGLGEADGKPTVVYAMCYYDAKPIEIPELKHLIELTKELQQEGDVYYMIFSKAGFHENAKTVASTIKNIMLVGLDDIVG